MRSAGPLPAWAAARSPSPWLAPLPPALLLRGLPAPGSQGRASGPPGAGRAPIPFGLIDLPGLQRQQAAALDPDAFGHLMAAGAPRSGRSQLLRTLAAAAAGHSCADLHLYGLDGGNGALLPLADLPHCWPGGPPSTVTGRPVPMAGPRPRRLRGTASAAGTAEGSPDGYPDTGWEPGRAGRRCASTPRAPHQ